MDFVQARNRMVDSQVRPSDVTDFRILAAMLELPRERFVAPDQAELAYADRDVSMRAGAATRCLLRARTFAKLVQQADIAPTDRALDVGCGTGYGAAVLSRLAAEVTALEEDAVLACLAGEALAASHMHNVAVVEGRLTAGWPGNQPYDVIVVEGAIEVAPQDLFDQ